MIVNYLIDLLKGCEYLKDFNIATGFLSEKSNSVSVVYEGNQKILRKYCDGAKIKSEDFSLIVRLNSYLGDNAENILFLEKLALSLPSLRLSDTTNFIPLGIEVKSGPQLNVDNIHSLKYEIKCRFIYLQE